MRLPDDPTLRAQIRDAVRAAAARPEVSATVAAIYADVQSAVDARRPKCDISGRCCRFEEYGHRLYVSTIELAAFVSGLTGLPTSQREKLDAAAGGWDGTGCPFQIAKLCAAHTIRPFGCRIYFCDPTAQDWQQDVYEQVHARLKAEHERLGVPYYYLEWGDGLRVALADESSGTRLRVLNSG
ncbi:MAG TPA: hypothetical protein VEA69_00035 [Tepidisphaeraceae bacterium]|nr:hypothetical protein [Tepidisphaeraceae bacterium]